MVEEHPLKVLTVQYDVKIYFSLNIRHQII